MSFNSFAAKGFGVAIPFVDLLGFELTQFAGGESVILYTPKPEHANSFAVAHGGVVMTLLDVTMATAARSVSPDTGVVTIEMKTTFMRPSPLALLTAKGKLIHRTATMAFTEASIFDEAGRVCASATGTFKYVKRLLPARAAPQISTD
ncbi:MAG: PaaI family thioesterase [Cytophagales bacterium]|nr:PaaI family thioesterase [Cytophagales bacterium]